MEDRMQVGQGLWLFVSMVAFGCITPATPTAETTAALPKAEPVTMAPASVIPPPYECPNHVESTCSGAVNVGAPLATDRWMVEFNKRFEEELPKLNRCLVGSKADKELRVSLRLDFTKTPAVLEPQVTSTNVSDCALIGCMKRALAGFQIHAAPPTPHVRVLELAAPAGRNSAWLSKVSTGAPPEEFISEAEQSNACVDAAPARTVGSLPPETIQRTVRGYYGRFRKCYEEGLGRTRDLCGRVQMRFVIGEQGKVSGVVPTDGTSMPDCEVVECIRKEFSEIEFPAPERGTITVVYPIMFQPG